MASDSCKQLTGVERDVAFCCCFEFHMCCAFLDAFLLTMVVNDGYFSVAILTAQTSLSVLL